MNKLKGGKWFVKGKKLLYRRSEIWISRNEENTGLTGFECEQFIRVGHTIDSIRVGHKIDSIRVGHTTDSIRVGHTIDSIRVGHKIDSIRSKKVM